MRRCRRRWRRAAHRPIGLDVLPQDLRRQGKPRYELLNDNYRSPIPEPLRWRNWAADAEGMTGDELLEFVNNRLFPTLRTCSPARRQARLRHPQRLRGRLQLHEVRPPDTPGDQQDRRRPRLPTRPRTVTCSATSTNRSCATCRTPGNAGDTTPRPVAPVHGR